MSRSERRQQRYQQRQALTQEIAYDLYQRRMRRGYSGNSDQDWKQAARIVKSPVYRASFRVNQWFTRQWRRSINWYESTPVEHALDTLNNDLKKVAIFDLLSLLANVTIITSLLAFLTTGERQRHDEQIYAAWQVITSAYNQPGSGGRKRALEFLNSTPGTPGRRRWFGMPWHKESLQGVDVGRANLSGVRLPGAILWNANLQDTILWEANLQDAKLQEANLQGADLRYGNFQSATFWGANLQNTDLRDANFRGSFLREADLQGADLEFSSLQSAIFTEATLKDTSLSHANLQNANFENADLQRTYLGSTNLRGANLQSVEFQGALLLQTDLRRAKELTPEQLNEATLCNVALPVYIENIDPNRDCNSSAQAILKIVNAKPSRKQPLTLEQAEKIVEKIRNSQWQPL